MYWARCVLVDQALYDGGMRSTECASSYYFWWSSKLSRLGNQLLLFGLSLFFRKLFAGLFTFMFICSATVGPIVTKSSPRSTRVEFFSNNYDVIGHLMWSAFWKKKQTKLLDGKKLKQLIIKSTAWGIRAVNHDIISPLGLGHICHGGRGVSKIVGH